MIPVCVSQMTPFPHAARHHPSGLSTRTVLERLYAVQPPLKQLCLITYTKPFTSYYIADVCMLTAVHRHANFDSNSAKPLTGLLSHKTQCLNLSNMAQLCLTSAWNGASQRFLCSTSQVVLETTASAASHRSGDLEAPAERRLWRHSCAAPGDGAGARRTDGPHEGWRRMVSWARKG